MTGPFIHNIDPIIGQIGELYLWWYGLSYSLGFLCLFLWLYNARDSLAINIRQVYDLTILIALGVLIGGRSVEVIFYEWAYYSTHSLHIFWVWLGGMSTHGILLGGTLAAWLFCRVNQKRFLPLADGLMIPSLFIMGVGRMGNFIDGQIVGAVTDVWWAVKFPDADGFRHPVVLYDGLKNLLLIPVLLLIRRKNPPHGILLGTFLFGYGFFRIFIDFYREYRTELFGLPPGQEFNIAMSILGITLIFWFIKRGHVRTKPLLKSGPVKGQNMQIRKINGSRRFVLLTLLIFPLLIPSDWTQDVPTRYGKRHHGLVHSELYPEIVTIINYEEL